MTSIILPTDVDLSNFTPSDQTTFWTEKVDNVAPALDEFSTKFAHATLYAWIPGSAGDIAFEGSAPSTYYNIINKILGYSYLNPSNQLSRVNPQCHPRFPNLYAMRIVSSQGHQFMGRQTGYNLPAAQVGTGITQYAKYGRTLIQVDFAPVKYTILEDYEVYGDPDYDTDTWPSVGEYSRNVEYTEEFKTYVINVQGLTQFKYLEGPGSMTMPEPRTYPGEINYIECKVTFNLLWRQVPEEYVLDTVNYGLGYPVKFGHLSNPGGDPGGAVGSVNSEDFLGYPPGVLLLLEPSVDRYLAPTLRRLDPREPVFYCDVQMPLIHFDPPNAGTYFGHNLKPYWSNNSTAFTYYLVGSNNTSGPFIYKEFNFNNLFTYWEAGDF